MVKSPKVKVILRDIIIFIVTFTAMTGFKYYKMSNLEKVYGTTSFEYNGRTYSMQKYNKDYFHYHSADEHPKLHMVTSEFLPFAFYADFCLHNVYNDKAEDVFEVDNGIFKNRIFIADDIKTPELTEENIWLIASDCETTEMYGTGRLVQTEDKAKVIEQLKDGKSVDYITKQLGWEENSELWIRFSDFPFIVNAAIYSSPETEISFFAE